MRGSDRKSDHYELIEDLRSILARLDRANQDIAAIYVAQAIDNMLKNLPSDNN